MFTSKHIAIGIVAAAGLTAGAGAHALTSQQGPQRHELRALGLGVMSVTAAIREARVIVQCGDGRGALVTVKLQRGVDLAPLTPGATVGAVVLTPDNLVVRLAPAPPTCRRDTLEGVAASGTGTMPAGAPMSSNTQPAETPAADGASRAEQSPAITATRLGTSAATSRSHRTWTFFGKAKRDDLGVLSLDVDRVNLPASYVTQRYLFTDHHARMVVARATAISDVTGRRISALQLDDATVRVQASIATPSTWRSDDEGRRVPTIIVKRIVVLEFDQ